MEKIMLQTPYYAISFDEEKRLLRNQWLSRSEELNKEQIMDSVLIMVQKIKELRPILVMSDDRERMFAFDVDIQNWVGNTVAEACIEIGIKKYALILPQDLIAQLSTEQTVEEIPTLPFDFNYFEEEDKAFRWLIR